MAQNEEAPFSRRDFMLYATTVFSWSASWYVLKVNSGYGVDPAVSTCWRFMLAAMLMFLIVSISGGQLRFGWRTHIKFALLGVFMFSSNFILFFYASTLLVSGLLAVVFSLASVVNLSIGMLRGDLAGPRRWFGATLGVIGIALLYWPAMSESVSGKIGLILCVFGTISFCIGNQITQTMKGPDRPLLSTANWGMAYGAIWSAIVSAVIGVPFAYSTAPGYTISLLFLTLVSTILAFWAYMNLIRSIGAGRASYATVMFPVFALLLSTFVEGYIWTPMAFIGVAMALIGNMFVLKSARGRGARLPTPVV